MNQYKIYVISNKPHLFQNIKENIYPEQIEFFNGENYPSFSKLVNDCVVQCPTETVIIMSDKVLPTSDNIRKILDLLENGYAFVALYRLACFGFKKELFRKIGMFDERFLGGGYEDDDFYIRLKESNVAVYITEEIEYQKSKSSWNYGLAAPHFVRKWGDKSKTKGIAVRNLDEENYNYDLGSSIPVKYLSWDDSIINANRAKRYRDIAIKSEKYV
jgi:hypothetical protein